MLYRAYRPTQFRDLLGQDALRITLQRALVLGRVGHAYLFNGPRGTGKTTAARLLARSVCCTQPLQDINEGTFEPCGTCESCLSILNGSATDVNEIDAASNRGIDDVRELRQHAAYPPSTLTKRVFIIDEVHMLTIEAFNALLKTLEEPTPHTLFILATTELHKVPFTVRSRCQTLTFKPAPTEVISAKLSSIVKNEKVQAEPQALALIADVAAGGFRDAEVLLDSLIAEYNTLTVDGVRKTLGIAEEKTVRSLMGAALSRNPADVQRALLDLPTNLHLERLLTSLTENLRERLRDGSVELPLGTYALQQLLEAQIIHRTIPEPLAALELAIYSIATYTGTNTREVSAEIATLAPTAMVTASVPVIEISQEPEPAVNPPSPDVRKAWKLVIEAISKENAILGQTIKQTVLHMADNATLTVHVKYPFHAEKLNESKNHARVTELLAEHSGEKWKVVYIVVTNLPRQRTNRSIASGMDDAVAVFGAKS